MGEAPQVKIGRSPDLQPRRKSLECKCSRKEVVMDAWLILLTLLFLRLLIPFGLLLALGTLIERGSGNPMPPAPLGRM